MPALSDASDQFAPDSRAAWRAWLEQNHASAGGVWLVYHKKGSGQPSVPYAEAVEEALCFGWIDSLTKPIDAARYRQLFTPRKPRSPWSKSNKERVERLIAQGLMTPAGLARIEQAKQTGTWTIYDGIEALEVPPDLENALRQNGPAHAHFQTFGDSTRKQIFWWIESAKRPETRANRIAQVVTAAAEKRNPLQYVRADSRTQSKTPK